MSQVQSRDEPFSSRVGLVRWELVPFNSPIEREWQGDDLERPPVALTPGNLATAGWDFGPNSALACGGRSKPQKNRCGLGNPSKVVSHPINVFE